MQKKKTGKLFNFCLNAVAILANKNDKNSATKPKAGAAKAAPQNQGSTNNNAGNAKPKKG